MAKKTTVDVDNSTVIAGLITLILAPLVLACMYWAVGTSVKISWGIATSLKAEEEIVTPVETDMWRLNLPAVPGDYQECLQFEDGSMKCFDVFIR